MFRLIESDPILRMLGDSMFDEVPQISPYSLDPLGRPQIRSCKQMLNILNHVTISAPSFDEKVHKISWVGFPINVILN
jgi:hypothetical protein